MNRNVQSVLNGVERLLHVARGNAVMLLIKKMSD